MEILTITYMVSALYTIMCSNRCAPGGCVRLSGCPSSDNKIKPRESDSSNDNYNRSSGSNKNAGCCTGVKTISSKTSNKYEKANNSIRPRKSHKKHYSSSDDKDYFFKSSKNHVKFPDSLISSSRSHKKHDSSSDDKVCSFKSSKKHEKASDSLIHSSKSHKNYDSRTSGKVISGKSLQEPIFLSSNKNCIFVKTNSNCFKTDKLDGICNKRVKRECIDESKSSSSCSSDSLCIGDSSCSSSSSSSSSSCSKSDSSCSEKVQPKESCYERIMCKENDLICKEIKKEFNTTENNLLVMMNNYICAAEAIIMTNVSTILDHPENYVPPTTGETELEALITQITTDGNVLSTQAADALRNARITALTNITNCLRRLMNCEKVQLQRIISCYSVRDIQTNIINFQITSAINNIIINVRDCMTRELNDMVEKQKAILIAESKKAGGWPNLNTYLTELDTIKNTMQTDLITSIGTMATDAAAVNTAINAAILALTTTTLADVEAMLKAFVNSILALLFVNPAPVPIVFSGGIQAPAIPPNSSKPKPTNPNQSEAGPSYPAPSAPDLNDLDSADEEE